VKTPKPIRSVKSGLRTHTACRRRCPERFFSFDRFHHSAPLAAHAFGRALLALGIANLYPTFLPLAISRAKPNEANANARTTLASRLAILVFPFVLGGLADRTAIYAFCASRNATANVAPLWIFGSPLVRTVKRLASAIVASTISAPIS